MLTKMKLKDYSADSYKLRLWRHFFAPLLTLLVVAVIGVIGFMKFNHTGFLEAFYMVVVTLTTVGYRMESNLSPAGMVFDSLFVMISIILLVVVIGKALEFIVSGEFTQVRRLMRMEKKIEWLSNHYIICGFGRVGHQIAKSLDEANIPYAVIDSKEETSEELEDLNIPYLIGDVTLDKNLERAGIAKAQGLIASADSDTANVFVTLSARGLNPNLYIIARAGMIDSEEKLKKAGANRVVSPYFIAGKHIAEIAIKHKTEAKA
ncbi:MAG: NAD-binding protein [Candidatus Saganbacteria bacterium]|nr:NAD-binding protein [Candidatus Saganbacteria bacterium]